MDVLGKLCYGDETFTDVNCADLNSILLTQIPRKRLSVTLRWFQQSLQSENRTVAAANPESLTAIRVETSPKGWLHIHAK